MDKTQKEVAASIGVVQTSLQQWEVGKRMTPVPYLHWLMDQGYSANWLVRGYGAMHLVPERESFERAFLDVTESLLDQISVRSERPADPAYLASVAKNVFWELIQLYSKMEDMSHFDFVRAMKKTLKALTDSWSVARSDQKNDVT